MSNAIREFRDAVSLSHQALFVAHIRAKNGDPALLNSVLDRPELAKLYQAALVAAQGRPLADRLCASIDDVRRLYFDRLTAASVGMVDPCGEFDDLCGSLDAALVELSALCPDDADTPPPKTQKAGRPRGTVDSRMRETLQARPEAVSWSAEQWATHLKCSKGTIGATEAWETIMKAREMAKLDRTAER